MQDFEGKPWGSTDEDGETGFVGVKASTASIATATAWLLGDGIGEVLCPDESRRVRPEGLEPRHLVVKLPAAEDMPASVPVALLVRSGQATAWWEFGIYDATEDVPDYDFETSMERRRAEHAAMAKRRAAEDRGPWWWRLQVQAAAFLLSVGSRLKPDDEASVTWCEAGIWRSETVRGWGDAG